MPTATAIPQSATTVQRLPGEPNIPGMVRFNTLAKGGRVHIHAITPFGNPAISLSVAEAVELAEAIKYAASAALGQ